MASDAMGVLSTSGSENMPACFPVHLAIKMLILWYVPPLVG